MIRTVFLALLSSLLVASYSSDVSASANSANFGGVFTDAHLEVQAIDVPIILVAGGKPPPIKPKPKVAKKLKPKSIAPKASRSAAQPRSASGRKLPKASLSKRVQGVTLPKRTQRLLKNPMIRSAAKDFKGVKPAARTLAKAPLTKLRKNGAQNKLRSTSKAINNLTKDINRSTAGIGLKNSPKAKTARSKIEAKLVGTLNKLRTREYSYRNAKLSGARTYDSDKKSKTAMQHITRNHGATSKVPGKSKLLPKYSKPLAMRALVRSTLKNGDGKVGKDGFVSVTRKFKNPVGKDVNGKPTRYFTVFTRAGQVQTGFPGKP